MERVNAIWKNADYQKYLKANESAEEERIFCKHTMPHFLDVARLGMLLNLEEQIFLSAEAIYAAALLHDIGRFIQYANGTPHEQASMDLAGDILDACGFSGQEKEDILSAVRNHRNQNVKNERSLRGIIYRADKMSRACFACPVENQCNWKAEKKNMELLR